MDISNTVFFGDGNGLGLISALTAPMERQAPEWVEERPQVNHVDDEMSGFPVKRTFERPGDVPLTF